MKVVQLIVRDPSGSVQAETFDMNDVKLHTEAGWLKMTTKDGTPVKWIPSDKVCLIQFGEKQEPDVPRILRPDQIAQGGPRAVPS